MGNKWVDRLKGRTDEIAASRLSSIHVDQPEKPEAKAPKDHWVVRLLSGQSVAGKVIGIGVDVALEMLPKSVSRMIGIARKNTKEAVMPDSKPLSRKWFKARAKEPSTWIGILIGLGAIGWFTDVDSALLGEAIAAAVNDIIKAGISIGAVYDIIRREKSTEEG